LIHGDLYRHVAYSHHLPRFLGLKAVYVYITPTFEMKKSGLFEANRDFEGDAREQRGVNLKSVGHPIIKPSF